MPHRKSPGTLQDLGPTYNVRKTVTDFIVAPHMIRMKTPPPPRASPAMGFNLLHQKAEGVMRGGMSIRRY